MRVQFVPLGLQNTAPRPPLLERVSLCIIMLSSSTQQEVATGLGGGSVLPFILNDPRKSSLQASGLCFQEFATLSWLLVHALYTLCLAEFCVKQGLRRHLSPFISRWTG